MKTVREGDQNRNIIYIYKICVYLCVCVCVCVYMYIYVCMYVYIYMGALVGQEHILKEMNAFLKETLVTEKKIAYNVLVYTAFLHPAVMADIFKCTSICKMDCVFCP